MCNINIITIITKHLLLYNMCNIIIINDVLRAITYLPLRFFPLLNTVNIYINDVTVSCRYLIALFTALLVYSFIIMLLCLLYFCNSGTTISFRINKVLSYIILSFISILTKVDSLQVVSLFSQGVLL